MANFWMKAVANQTEIITLALQAKMYKKIILGQINIE